MPMNGTATPWSILKRQLTLTKVKITTPYCDGIPAPVLLWNTTFTKGLQMILRCWSKECYGLISNCHGKMALKNIPFLQFLEGRYAKALLVKPNPPLCRDQ